MLINLASIIITAAATISPRVLIVRVAIIIVVATITIVIVGITTAIVASVLSCPHVLIGSRPCAYEMQRYDNFTTPSAWLPRPRTPFARELGRTR